MNTTKKALLLFLWIGCGLTLFAQYGELPLKPAGDPDNTIGKAKATQGSQSGQSQLPGSQSSQYGSVPVARPSGSQSGQYELPPSRLQLPGGQSSQYGSVPPARPSGSQSRQYAPVPPELRYDNPPAKPVAPSLGTGKPGGQFSQYQLPPRPTQNPYQELPLRPKTKWEKVKALPGKVKAKATYLPKKVKKAVTKPGPSKTQKKRKMR